ncbi:flavin reductase family protein [Streptomyces sp. NBC_01551]|uniref:flavin reductase family protein n=1 Tax=Streptomyces sp. NBC_01551 TaxID=2975876 RepID=UPI00225049EB|nr:flavin reductase family protein [Streptomyces sp. NBC_01551]MCX4527043.1 flavin reductase family protein [Streptomyces sp. NBC_01551]
MAQDTSTPVDGHTFREAMALLAAPLTIVATRDAHGHRKGFTASAVTSVSLDPPLLLVGLSNDSSCRAALTAAAGFTVNVLGSHHAAAARQFASRGVDRFAGLGFEDWTGTDLPYLADAAAVLHCRTADLIPVGDHHLLIGEVTGVRTHGVTEPLLWHRRGFHSTREVG